MDIIAKIELTQNDLQVIEDALLIVSGGNSFSARCRSFKVNKLTRLWEVTDGLRDIIKRIKQGSQQPDA